MALIIKNRDIAKAYSDIKQYVYDVHQITLNLRNEAESFSVGANKIDQYVGQLKNIKADLELLKTTTGLGQFAKDQEADQSYDVVAEYNAMAAQLDLTIQWAIDNLPKDGSGYELTYTRDSAGNKIPRQFSPAQTATFRTQLDALLATINVVA